MRHYLFPPQFASEPFTGDLEQIKQRKVIRALVTYGKADFFIRHGGLHGIQVELLSELEKDINKSVKRAVNRVKVKYIPVSFDQLIPALKSGKGDIAAAFLTETPFRLEEVKITTSTKLTTNEILVTHKDITPVQSIEELSGRELYLLKNSSYIEHVKLMNLQLSAKGLKPITIVEADQHLLSEDILEMVNAGTVLMTVVDQFKAELWQNVLPNIQLHNHIVIHNNAHLGWAVRKDNNQLHHYLNDFINRKVKKGSLLGNYLFNRYYKSTRWIKGLAQKGARDRFNKLAPIFKKYASKYNFDYLALAALGYQESKLDNSIVSHRGAIGIMQLLPTTAKDMGINNIHLADKNIEAGTKYLQWLRTHYVNDSDITPENQLALSWAAYNAGPANFRKMQNLAKKMNLNPHIWFGNVELAAGKIIGSETVLYVSNIYKYYVAYHLYQQLEKTQRLSLKPH